MDTGTKISGAAHVAVIGWALLAGRFDSEPLPMAVQEVSVISAAEYAALAVQPETPDLAAEPVAPTPPADVAEAPDIAASEADSRPEPVLPETQPLPEPESLPEAEAAPVSPQAEISEDVATLVVPQLPEYDTAPTADTPVPRPVERVAPVPVAAPAPEARPDPIPEPEVVPEEGAETPREAQEAAQPEEAVDEITPEPPEPDVSKLAPSKAPRPPRTRPRPPAPRVAEVPPPAEADPTPQETGRADAVTAALSEALEPSPPSQPAAPAGPPLSAGEKDALRVAVGNCWNTGSLSTEAAAMTIVVAVEMARDGKPVLASIRMLSSEGGSDAAARQAFQAARRAIIRCGARGYDLPREKYAHWREIEMTFSLERMRIR